MRVLIVDDEPIIRMDIREMLQEKHCIIVGEASDGETAVNLARNLRPDVVLMDIKMPGSIDGLEAAKIINEEEICPVVLLTAYSQYELVEEASSVVGIFGYLVKPIKEEDILPALNMAIAKWSSYKKLKEENNELKNKLESRKIIEIAKGIIMEKYKLSEKEAYKKMQKLSMDFRKNMVEIAKYIIINNKFDEIMKI
ncbi:ANTAR domain-containing response regulator [Thermovenabulum gondwanense]|uniref:Stage 0 sporulation protein A homolog n=1 Tax=Thermovenabulum gondwanense TaxID=520767 RepID=A0A162M636_9FIRM|nr:response regulator [Thermovenabulum gondwanense]KYO64159.1 putative transcriptional regulatory protein pdtaR [Thermovenabulum gondwanense]